MFNIVVVYKSHEQIQNDIKEIAIKTLKDVIAASRGNMIVLQELKQLVCEAKGLISEAQFELTYPELARKPRNGAQVMESTVYYHE